MLKCSILTTGLLVLMLALPLASAEPDLREAVRAEVEQLRERGRLSVASIHVGASMLIPEVYERRGFAPLWGRVDRIRLLLSAIRSSEQAGLAPRDYQPARIEQYLATLDSGRPMPPRARAAYDVMLTDSLARLAHNLRYGKIDPATLELQEDYDRPLAGRPASAAIGDLAEAESISAAVAALAPQSPQYQRLLAQLQRHRILAERGAWPAVPDGLTLRPGASDSRVGLLASRLVVSGDLAGSAVSPTQYDDTLADAVRRFQVRHGLEPDALVGPATYQELNVPIAARIEQIRLNLERARWVMPGLNRDYVLVNIAGFRAYVVRDGDVRWTTRVIVGETDDQTPVFRATMKYVVFNPTWTVPHRIATEELLPIIQDDPGYLVRGQYDLFDRAGNLVSAADIPWDNLGPDRFPYTIVQRPGPANQLGRLKFVFPNEFSVCMHDTPGKHLFARAERTFSHGCIRVDRPMDLAAVLLGDDGWDRRLVDEQIESRETKTVFLAEPLPVMLLYWTAEVDDSGIVYFYPDVYERDEMLLKALDKPFQADRL